MRANVKIVGVGQRRNGTSASGRSYDFTPLAFVFEDNQFQGYRAATVNVDAKSLSGYVPAVGDSYDMVFHFADNRLFVDAIIDQIMDK